MSGACGRSVPDDKARGPGRAQVGEFPFRACSIKKIGESSLICVYT
jgi:hypothetical protein